MSREQREEVAGIIELMKRYEDVHPTVGDPLTTGVPCLNNALQAAIDALKQAGGAPCKSVLNLNGEHFDCTAAEGHSEHANSEAGAIWK